MEEFSEPDWLLDPPASPMAERSDKEPDEASPTPATFGANESKGAADFDFLAAVGYAPRPKPSLDSGPTPPKTVKFSDSLTTNEVPSLDDDDGSDHGGSNVSNDEPMSPLAKVTIDGEEFEVLGVEDDEGDWLLDDVDKLTLEEREAESENQPATTARKLTPYGDRWANVKSKWAGGPDLQPYMEGPRSLTQVWHGALPEQSRSVEDWMAMGVPREFLVAIAESLEKFMSNDFDKFPRRKELSHFYGLPSPFAPVALEEIGYRSDIQGLEGSFIRDHWRWDKRTTPLPGLFPPVLEGLPSAIILVEDVEPRAPLSPGEHGAFLHVSSPLNEWCCIQEIPIFVGNGKDDHFKYYGHYTTSQASNTHEKVSNGILNAQDIGDLPRSTVINVILKIWLYGVHYASHSDYVETLGHNFFPEAWISARDPKQTLKQAAEAEERGNRLTLDFLTKTMLQDRSNGPLGFRFNWVFLQCIRFDFDFYSTMATLQANEAGQQAD
ncbi:MAG: hypothetical protein M1820_002916 [Bogoriella megaspora]|nr:MAG: hypothetical protein M1820_002916 [Bogoriella megaspora]